MKKLKEAREIYDFKNVWTSGEKILFKDGSGNISYIYAYKYMHNILS